MEDVHHFVTFMMRPTHKDQEKQSPRIWFLEMLDKYIQMFATLRTDNGS